MSLRNAAAVLLAVTPLLLSACCDRTVNEVELRTPGDSAWSFGVAPIWVNDTLPAEGVAICAYGWFCFHEAYTSRTRPERFTYQALDPSIIAIDGSAALIGRGPGLGWVTVTTAGITDSIPIRVEPAVVRFAQSIDVATPRKGDSVSLHISAIGPDGQPTSVSGSDTYIIAPIPSLTEPLVLTKDPSIRRFAPRSSGLYRIVTEQSHLTRSGRQTVADTIRFTVLPADSTAGDGNDGFSS